MSSPVRRREGFPGQRHCVVPPAVVVAARRHPLLRGLHPTAAGLYPRATGHFVARRHGAAGTVMLLCRDGAGWVRTPCEHTTMLPGDVALLAPNEPHSYGAAEDAPWTIEWAHYGGDEAPAWRELVLGASAGIVVRLPPASTSAVTLAGVYQRLEHGYGDFQLLEAAADLRASLAAIAQLRRTPGAMPSTIDAVDATAAWMRAHLEERITLGQLARRACLSASHYSAVFRRRYGYAPVDWLIRQRIQRACMLLQGGNEKIAWVAREVGIADAYYFSRLFRRVMGVSPRSFRLHG